MARQKALNDLRRNGNRRLPWDCAADKDQNQFRQGTRLTYSPIQHGKYEYSTRSKCKCKCKYLCAGINQHFNYSLSLTKHSALN
jgi:hypothetical protein